MASKIDKTRVDLTVYQTPDTDFAHLSLRDLMDARDLYHIQLMRYENVVATAVGRYRIRHSDSWPNERPARHSTGVRTLTNSEVRPYSWPAILVFVSQWESRESLTTNSDELVPTTLYLPDGRRVPVCVIEAPRESKTEIAAPDVKLPVNNIGPGYPVVARVQGQTYLATVGCLVSDGHKIFALTNKHVTGDSQEEIFARSGASDRRVGVSVAKQLGRLPFTTVYPSFAGRDTFVNLDFGLIEIDEIDQWTTKVRGIGVVGQMADFSDVNLTLSLIGCRLRAVGAASGDMRGEIAGLFYRYKKSGGFEYVADLLIGPRSTGRAERGKSDQPAPDFRTLPGDSGAMWMLEPADEHSNGGKKTRGQTKATSQDLRPLAIQWGRQMLRSAGRAEPQGFALATLMSRACALLDVDPVRDWNLDQTDTWGAIGHFSIAARSQVALSSRLPKLVKLMKDNADIISRSDADIAQGNFVGMGSDEFVPMADVPDFFWKERVAKQGHARHWEGPNHFADMDQENPDGKTLLDLTKDDSFIDPDRWEGFYDTVVDLLKGDPIAPQHRGLLPFRVWQIFDEMVDLAVDGDAARFVCAGGVLTHYIGDACQPLHISYLHDGDPTQPQEHVFSTGKKAGQTELRPLGEGVHSAYEDAMVFANRETILDGLKQTPKVARDELISTGFEAARLTIEMMRTTFETVPPADIVDAFLKGGAKNNRAMSQALWKAFGKKTVKVMQSGAHLVAVLWESAWAKGEGERKVLDSDIAALTEQRAMEIVSDPAFLPSMTIGKIGAVLKGRQNKAGVTRRPLTELAEPR